MRLKRIALWMLAAALCLGTLVCCATSYRQTSLCITLIDVQDGDCILITAPNGHAMMIDTGYAEHRDDVEGALDDAGVTTLDRLILTHPHSDHIGSALWVLQHYSVGQVDQIDLEYDTETYRKLQDYLVGNNINVKAVRAGDSFDFAGASCRYLAPVSINPNDANNSSAVLRMEYKGKVFLFMGDAEWDEEAVMMAIGGEDLNADVLKVGHHALHSTSTAFLKAVTPEVALISCADPSKSDDPAWHRANMANIANYAGSLYSTHKNGDILLIYDGKTITVKTAK